MSRIGRACLLEQQADQFMKIIAETVEDEITRQELLATVRSVSRQAVEAIMNTPDGAEVGQKWSKVSVQVGQ
jgi:hypothetical protein